MKNKKQILKFMYDETLQTVSNNIHKSYFLKNTSKETKEEMYQLLLKLDCVLIEMQHLEGRNTFSVNLKSLIYN